MTIYMQVAALFDGKLNIHFLAEMFASPAIGPKLDAGQIITRLRWVPPSICGDWIARLDFAERSLNSLPVIVFILDFEFFQVRHQVLRSPHCATLRLHGPQGFADLVDFLFIA